MNTPAHVSAEGVPELSIADRLLIARRLTRLDVRDFADRVGISRSTVSNYENPDYTRQRKPLYLKAWALGAGVSYTWLATGQPPDPDGASDQPNVALLCFSGGQLASAGDPAVTPLAA
jgi:transcriptional regulator with XRE-family HTH domain